MLIQSRCARCSCMLKHARLGVCWHHPPSRSPRGCLATAKPPQITHPVALSRIPSRVALAIASFFFGLWKVEPLSVSLSCECGCPPHPVAHIGRTADATPPPGNATTFPPPGGYPRRCSHARGRARACACASSSCGFKLICYQRTSHLSRAPPMPMSHRHLFKKMTANFLYS